MDLEFDDELGKVAPPNVMKQEAGQAHSPIEEPVLEPDAEILTEPGEIEPAPPLATEQDDEQGHTPQEEAAR